MHSWYCCTVVPPDSSDEIASFERNSVFVDISSWFDLAKSTIREVQIFAAFSIAVLSFKAANNAKFIEGRHVESILIFATSTNEQVPNRRRRLC